MDNFIYLIILAVLAVIGLPLAAIVVMVDTRKNMAFMQSQIDRIGVGLHELQLAARLDWQRKPSCRGKNGCSGHC